MKKRSVWNRIRCTALCGVLALAVLLGGCEFATVSGQMLDNPKLAIVGFIDAMKADEFDRIAADEAMKYIGNYSAMGFEKYTMLGNGTLEKKLFDLLRGSYTVTFTDNDMGQVTSPYSGEDMRISGKKAFVTVTFTSLDIQSMSVPLSEAVSEIGGERAYEGETFETEESAMALIEEVFPLVFDENDLSEYCVSRELTLELDYHENGWRLNISDDFYNALLGE